MDSGKDSIQQEDMNKSADVRRIIEKVEAVDSVDVDEIHSRLDEISEEKAATKRVYAHKEDGIRKKIENVMDISKLKELPGAFFNRKDNLKEDHKDKIGIEIVDSNPYLEVDNVTAFID